MQLGQNLRIPQTGTHRLSQILITDGLEVRQRGGNLLLEAVEVIGPVEAEGSIDDGQLDDELDSRGGAQLEIGSGLNQERRIGETGKGCGNVGQPRGIELQLILPQDADLAGVEEKRRR